MNSEGQLRTRRRHVALATAFVAGVTVGVVACSKAGQDSGGTVADTEDASGTGVTGSDDTGNDGTGPLPCIADDECDDANVCNGTERCTANGVCERGEPPDAGTSCGDDRVCADGACVDVICGNGAIEPGEQCDDGNTATFDGCDASCRYELFYRSYEVILMQSPAGSFCDRPNSALGDALAAFALDGENAARKADIDNGAYNSIAQLLNLEDLTGNGDEVIEFRDGLGVPDPAGGWPADGSNPIDGWFLLEPTTLADDGGIANRIASVSLSGGSIIGGPGETLLELPEFLDSSVRARFDYSSDPDVPAPPPDALAEGLVVPREILGDGEDEGICGNLTVAFIASEPADEALTKCIECPGESMTYTPCPGDVVTQDCNSRLDPLVGGCIVGGSCASGFPVIFPSQPDVDHGGPGPLENDATNLNKVPASMTDGNLNGYSAYFRFRARRVHVTGVAGG